MAVWEVALLLESYKRDAEAVAQHLGWPAAKVSAAANYAEAFPAEIAEALAENEAMDFAALKRMLPQATPFSAGKSRAQTTAR